MYIFDMCVYVHKYRDGNSKHILILNGTMTAKHRSMLDTQ